LPAEPSELKTAQGLSSLHGAFDEVADRVEPARALAQICWRGGAPATVAE
jgi:hypothetical protein